MDEVDTAASRKEGKPSEKQRTTTTTKTKSAEGAIKKGKGKNAGGKDDGGVGKNKTTKAKLKNKLKKKKARESKMDETSDADSDRSEDDSDDDSASSDPDADADRNKKKGRGTKKSKKNKQKKKKSSKDSKNSKKAHDDDSDTDDSLSVGSSAADESDEKETSDENDSSGSPNLDDRISVLEDYMNGLSMRNNPNPYPGSYGLDAMSRPNDLVSPPTGRPNTFFPPMALSSANRNVPRSLRRPGRNRGRRGTETNVTEKKSTRPEFKRVDWVWDTDRYTYKLQDTAKASTDSQYEGYVFHVRRTFDHEGKYRRTFVDIKSKLLRECLQDVIKNINGVSLVDDTPKLDPNMLFLYVEDLRAHLGALKDLEPAGETRKERKKNQRRLDDKRKHLKVLIKYVDKDFHDIKNTLEPMLQSGLITFELLWALWKPGTLVYSPTYGSPDTPRVFKVDVAERHCSMMKGDFYFVEAKYFEYDGKRFGYGNVGEEISEFKGARKITSLPCYPLQYHKEESELREKLIERGKKFVTLAGVHFKAYSGMAFMKRKKGVLKFNISNSRIMVDPAIFRRINPNYYVSHVKPKNHDVLSLGGDSSDSESGCGCDESEEDTDEDGKKKKVKYVIKMFKDEEGNDRWIRVRKDQLDDSENEEELDELPENKVVDGEVVKASEVNDEEKAAHKNDEAEEEETPKEEDKSADTAEQNEESPTAEPKDATDKSETQGDTQTPSSTAAEGEKDANKVEIPLLTDEEYLISSPVVLGFSFAEKQWLEFDVSSVQDIKWNDNAWDSLVLEPGTKDLIKALVESRKFSAATTIDDVIQGKGKGLVTVLHGPPGTGKTLTAEGISELLKCPLYMASAGELGTDSRFLEHELQKILDICHTWGAILLLDEADVFLEKRNMQDIHRNALVSIFLRQLEYFQGILFLTTNRVETFDEAFQSRIHIALRYDKLDAKAKRAIFRLFLERIQTHGKLTVKPFLDEDIAALAKHDLNGREIKNVMGSAQDLAVNKGEALSMGHVRLVLDVHAKFGRDLKGGSGFEDAMRSYF